VSALLGTCRLGAIAGLRRTIDEHDCRLALMTLDRVPAVAMVGDEDRLTPVRHAAVITQWLPHARLVVFAAAGHMLPLERADAVVDHLAALLESAGSTWDDSAARRVA
jgi:pimeloyl-ACP methyl ester carboxylesterase